VGVATEVPVFGSLEGTPFIQRSPLRIMSNDRVHIVVVDDTPDNLRLLSVMLSERGYKVRKALDGSIALKTIRQIPPDLILLDINMPGLTGYDVCQTLKGDPQTQSIPVIFISAIDDAMDKVKAFQAGGSDYITKPFQGEEICARIEHQLTLQRQKQQLQQEIAERQRVENRLQYYLYAVSHDLRNPVLGMNLVLEQMLQSDTDPLSVPRATFERMADSCGRQLHLIDALISSQQLETGGIALERQSLSLFELSQHLVADWQPLCQRHQTTIVNQISPDIPPIHGDRNQLWRVFENLFGNALKHNPPGLILTLNATIDIPSSDAQTAIAAVRCEIKDNGIGIPAQEIDSLFDRYQRGNGSRRSLGLGLGLYLCRQIVEAHGGRIGVEQVNPGTLFWFTLPQDRDRPHFREKSGDSPPSTKL
jgi:two-component system sensor histidine kinase/response regulator